MLFPEGIRMQIAFGCTGCHVEIRFRIKLALRKTEGRKSKKKKKTVPVNIFEKLCSAFYKASRTSRFSVIWTNKGTLLFVYFQDRGIFILQLPACKKILFFPLKMCWEEIIISRSLQVTEHASIFGSGTIFTFLLFTELLFSPLIV